jgi:DNA-binding transcriptional regulator YiaG
MSDPLALLRQAIDSTTGSARAFAGAIGVDERTIRRWLAEERPIPGPVVTLCRILCDRPALLIRPPP